MTTTSIRSTSTDTTAVAEPTLPMQTLTQEDFLKLLVAKMSAQDPLNPTQDTEFISQMAQFSTLEQSKSMQNDLAALRSDQQVTQANGLLGRTVQLQDDLGATVSGTVSAVQVVDGTPKLIVNNQAYDLSQLVMITPATT
jgi:flagellar basal-body rod modification protein FlgD